MAKERNRLYKKGGCDNGIDAKATLKFHLFPSNERDFHEIWVTRRESGAKTAEIEDRGLKPSILDPQSSILLIFFLFFVIFLLI